MRVLFALGLIVMTALARASDPTPHHFTEVQVGTDYVVNRSAQESVLFSEIVGANDAPWIRLYFDRSTDLGDPEANERAYIRLTSLKDGAVQTIDAYSLDQWQYSSAFFNGDQVQVELVAEPGAEAARVQVRELMVGEVPDPPRSICGPTDDRVLSFDNRAARLVPVGCTAWMINDANTCFLSAGHCFDGSGLQVIQFNVPLSNPDSSLNHPGPEDQYPMDGASLQWDQTVIGNDWGYFGAFPNGITQLTPFEAEGVRYTLGTPPASAGGETIRITGYGSTDGTQGTPLSWYLVQKTHTGTLTSVNGNVLQYTVDTTGGNSGSAIFNEDNGTAIGIHTNAGCSAGGGANNGMSMSNAALQSALAVPLGVCADGPPAIKVQLVQPVADPVSPNGGDLVEISVTDRNDQPVAVNGATLIYDNGGGDVSVPMSSRGTNLSATFPSMQCGQLVQFKVEVETQTGVTIHHPFSAQNSADRRFVHDVAITFGGTFSDNMETDMGWTVDSDPGLTDGAWDRGFPAGYGLRNDPPFDADGSGMAYLTHSSGGNTDVDGGATRLISPTMDATAPEATITYWRWFSVGGTADDDFLVEVSDDNGGSWTTLETVSSPGGSEWQFVSHRVGDFVNNTNQFRIRFTAVDGGTGSVVEAGVDSVKLYNDTAGAGCDGTIFGDGFES